MDFITVSVLIEYEKADRAVHVYPRKHIACIDGGKYYKVNHGTVERWQYYKKHAIHIK